MKKTFVILCIVSLLLLNISSVVAYKINSVNNIESELNKELLAKTGVENNHALIVGISDYNGRDNDLLSPSPEAKKMKETLVKCGWQSSNIELLRDDEAKKDNIITKLNWLSQFSGTVLFYYIGHGTQIKDDNGDEDDRKDEAIVPWEASKDMLITDDELKQIVNGFKADKIVLIFVSCFSGGMIEFSRPRMKNEIRDTKLLNNPKASNLFLSLINKPLFKNILLQKSDNIEEKFLEKQPMKELRASNTVILTACQEYISTLEYPVFGQPFAVWIRKTLDGGLVDGISPDKNDDKYISAEEAFEFAQPRYMLEMSTLMGYPLYLKAMIKQWIEGNATLGDVLIVITIMRLIFPVPQIYDGDPSEEIILTKV